MIRYILVVIIFFHLLNCTGFNHKYDRDRLQNKSKDKTIFVKDHKDNTKFLRQIEKKQINKTSPNHRSIVIHKKGSSPPNWQSELPIECIDLYFCGFSFKDDCQNENSCRSIGETEARVDLVEKNYGVRIRSKKHGLLRSSIDSEGNEIGTDEYSQETRESIRSVELINLEFQHFYWITKKQHMVFAKMQRPLENKNNADQNQNNKLSKLPIKIIVDDKNNNLLNEYIKDLIINFFKDENINLVNTNSNDTSMKKFNILQISLSSNILDHNGQFNLFKGISEVYITFLAKSMTNEAIKQKTWTVRRFINFPPKSLNQSEKNDILIKTLDKGVDEFSPDFLSFIN